jgi:IMP dehydrogenase/GMP reductase
MLLKLMPLRVLLKLKHNKLNTNFTYKNKMNKTALTYDDIQLVPKFSNIKSRTEISLRTQLSRNYNLIIPIVASPMDTVCET